MAPALTRRYEQAPSPGSDGACAADQVSELASADPARAVGAFHRPAIDRAVFNRVAWPPAMTAKCHPPGGPSGGAGPGVADPRAAE